MQKGDAVYYGVRYGTSKMNLDKGLTETEDTAAVIRVTETLEANVTYRWQVIAYTVRSEVHLFTTEGIAATMTKIQLLTDSLFTGGTLTITVAAEGTPAPEEKVA